jgi:hypothetical protein
MQRVEFETGALLGGSVPWGHAVVVGPALSAAAAREVGHRWRRRTVAGDGTPWRPAHVAHVLRVRADVDRADVRSAFEGAPCAWVTHSDQGAIGVARAGLVVVRCQNRGARRPPIPPVVTVARCVGRAGHVSAGTARLAVARGHIASIKEHDAIAAAQVVRLAGRGGWVQRDADACSAATAVDGEGAQRPIRATAVAGTVRRGGGLRRNVAPSIPDAAGLTSARGGEQARHGDSGRPHEPTIARWAVHDRPGAGDALAPGAPREPPFRNLGTKKLAAGVRTTRRDPRSGSAACVRHDGGGLMAVRTDHVAGVPRVEVLPSDELTRDLMVAGSRSRTGTSLRTSRFTRASVISSTFAFISPSP